jgi:damage-control phosphatase, subfamily I
MDAVIACSRIAATKIREGMSSVEFATNIHKCAYDVIGEKDPYSGLKNRSNEIALALFPDAERFVARSKDPVRAAMLVSIIGNVLDFGIEGSISSPESLKREFKGLLAEKLDCDDSKKVEKLIRDSDEIFFLVDNCGEIVFDRILLKKIGEMGKRIVLVIKGEPILTDVTMPDLKGLGLEELVDEIVETEGVAVGLNLWTKGVNTSLKSRLKKADLIISKGMANFEALSEYRWKAVAYLLRSKCETVSNELGVGKDISVIKLVRG